MDVSLLLDAAIGAAWLALAVVLVRARRRGDSTAPWLYLVVAFALLRSFDFVVVQAAGVDLSWLVRALDVLLLAGLLGIVFGAERLRRGLEQRQRQAETSAELAQRASSEYRRALHDYTRLTRHRLANPLTAITAGIATLRDLDLGLDRETRLEILAVMEETAGRLERAILHPETLSEEEGDLRPVPDLSDADVARLVEIDAVKAEEHFRDINHELIAKGAADSDRDLQFLCECAALDCTSTLDLPLHRYFAIHVRDDQFVICPGHEFLAVERVVERHEGHWVVRKHPEAVEAARDQL